MYRTLRIRCPEGSFVYHVLHLFTPVSMMDKLCKVGADRFHFIFGIRIAVWNSVYNFIEIIVFFDDVKACPEVNIVEVCHVGNPVVHFCNAIRGVDALTGESCVINLLCNYLSADVFA